jgi:hypothetical protein
LPYISSRNPLFFVSAWFCNDTHFCLAKVTWPEIPCTCVSNEENVCYVCGEVAFASQRCSIITMVKKAYQLSFGCKIRDRTRVVSHTYAATLVQQIFASGWTWQWNLCCYLYCSENIFQLWVKYNLASCLTSFASYQHFQWL